MLVDLQPIQTGAHKTMTEGANMAGGQLDDLRFFSTDMASSHKIYEQNCFNTVTAFINMQHSWKQRI